MNRSLRRILKYFQFAFVIIHIDLILSQSRSAVVDLGVPIQSPTRIPYKTARAFGGSKADLLCWTTSAESGGHFIAMDLKTQKIFGVFEDCIENGGQGKLSLYRLYAVTAELNHIVSNH
jgi:hypothetical protein